MPEITAAELRKLRALEERIVTVNDTLADVRAKRRELQGELTTTRRDLRVAMRTAGELEAKLDELIGENARLADELADARRDLERVAAEGGKLRDRNTSLETDLASTKGDLGEARKAARTAERSVARLEKQLAVTTDKLEGGDPPELTAKQLSTLLDDFVDSIGASRRLEIAGSRINLKVGFSGRGGGAFVIPSFGTDAKDLPELHELEVDLTRNILGAENETDVEPS